MLPAELGMSSPIPGSKREVILLINNLISKITKSKSNDLDVMRNNVYNHTEFYKLSARGYVKNYTF